VHVELLRKLRKRSIATIGAIILLWRKPAMKVMVFQSPCGT
jgi:hypothetical protein